VARLSRTEQRVVHRVTRECLRNVVKHADATRVVVTLSDTGKLTQTRDLAVERTDPHHQVMLAVDDDGVGFDPSTLPSREGHFGVRVLADLATDVGAVLLVSSSPNGGTRWRLALPAEGTP
jgi:signal transduction histidine kinase